MPKAAIPIICGFAGVIFCLTPGLLSNLMTEISAFRDSLYRGSPWFLPRPPQSISVESGPQGTACLLIFSASLVALGIYAALVD